MHMKIVFKPNLYWGFTRMMSKDGYLLGLLGYKYIVGKLWAYKFVLINRVFLNVVIQVSYFNK